ncbi:TTAGGG repeat binding factor [Dispira simplex]|nr:TTAGGG repeat binding factor [Dispira simplex]
MTSKSTQGSKSATTTKKNRFFARRADDVTGFVTHKQASLTDNEDYQQRTCRRVFYGRGPVTRSTSRAREDSSPRKPRKPATSSDSEDSLYYTKYDPRFKQKKTMPIKLQYDQGSTSESDSSPLSSLSNEEVVVSTDVDMDVEVKVKVKKEAAVKVKSEGKPSKSVEKLTGKMSQSVAPVEPNDSSNQTPEGSGAMTPFSTKDSASSVRNTASKEPTSSTVPEKGESLTLTPRYISKGTRYRVPTLNDCTVLDVHSTLLLKQMREVLDKAFALDDPVTEDAAIERWIKATQSNDWLEMCRSWLCFFVTLKSMLPITPNGFVEEHSMTLLIQGLSPAKQVWCRQVLARANVCLFFQIVFFSFLSAPTSLSDVYKSKSIAEPNRLCQMTLANLASNWQGRTFNPNNHIVELNESSKKLINAIRYFVPYVVYVSDTAMDEALLDFLVTVLTWAVFAHGTVIGMGNMISHTKQYFESIRGEIGTLHINMLPSSQSKDYKPRFPSPYFNPKNQLKRRLQGVKNKLEGATKETLYTLFHWHHDFGEVYRYLLGVLAQLSNSEKELTMASSPTKESISTQPQAVTPSTTSATSPSKPEAEPNSGDLLKDLDQLRRVSRWAESKVKEMAKGQAPLIPFTRSYRRLYATVVSEPQRPDKQIPLHRFNEKDDVHRVRGASTVRRTDSPLRTRLPLRSTSPKLTKWRERPMAGDASSDDSDASSAVSVMMGTEVDNQVRPLTQDTQDARSLLESTPLAASNPPGHATPKGGQSSKRKFLSSELNRYLSPTRQKRRKLSAEPTRIHRSPVGSPVLSVELRTMPPPVTVKHKVDLRLYPPSRYGKRSSLWTPEEYYYLEQGMQKHGTRWSCILADYGVGGRYNQVLSQRKSLTLKDKARNIRLWREAKGIPLGIYQIACSNVHYAK